MTLIFKTLILDLDLKVCILNNREIHLTKSEFLLLEFFIRHKNKIFSREELLRFGLLSSASKRAVDTNMSRLRKKLGDLGKYLITRQGFGYGLIDN